MRKLVITSVLTLATVSLLAQDPGKHNENNKLAALRIAFFTERLELTTEESSTFWIRFNEYESDLKQIKEKKKELGPHHKNIDDMSEAQIKKDIEAIREIDINEIDIRTEFILDCFSILDAQRAGKLPLLEREFRKAIVNKMNKDGRGPGPQRGPRGPNNR